MFFVTRRNEGDDCGRGDRPENIEYVCYELVERCRYVTQHIKFDLVSFHGIINVSFVYNTTMPAATLSSSFS